MSAWASLSRPLALALHFPPQGRQANQRFMPPRVSSDEHALRSVEKCARSCGAYTDNDGQFAFFSALNNADLSLLR